MHIRPYVHTAVQVGHWRRKRACHAMHEFFPPLPQLPANPARERETFLELHAGHSVPKLLLGHNLFTQSGRF